MPKSKSTRQPAVSSPAESDRKLTRPSGSDRMEIYLVSAHAAVRTVIRALSGKPCGDNELATVLIQMALQPIERLMQEVSHV
jgi:hypothetical protein